MWREALDTLPKQIQQELGQGDPKQKLIQQHVKELSEATKKRQQECEEKFWKLPVGDHEIILRDYAVKIVGCLKTIGDVAVQFAPPQASIPWSAVKVLMQVRIICLSE